NPRRRRRGPAPAGRLPGQQGGPPPARARPAGRGTRRRPATVARLRADHAATGTAPASGPGTARPRTRLAGHARSPAAGLALAGLSATVAPWRESAGGRVRGWRPSA